MWLAGAVGVATALGYYLVAFGVALFAVIVLAALKSIAHRMIGDDDDDVAPLDGEQKRPGGKTGKSAHT
jgi:putative Mg2+ transporter-C (MgtC) family protein